MPGVPGSAVGADGSDAISSRQVVGTKAGLEERVIGMMSWCTVTVLDMSWSAGGLADVESSPAGGAGAVLIIAHSSES